MTCYNHQKNMSPWKKLLQFYRIPFKFWAVMKILRRNRPIDTVKYICFPILCMRKTELNKSEVYNEVLMTGWRELKLTFSSLFSSYVEYWKLELRYQTSALRKNEHRFAKHHLLTVILFIFSYFFSVVYFLKLIQQRQSYIVLIRERGKNPRWQFWGC